MQCSEKSQSLLLPPYVVYPLSPLLSPQKKEKISRRPYQKLTFIETPTY